MPGASAIAMDDRLFNHKEITYLQDFKKNVNFSFMQAMALIAAYIAGTNKESMDGKIFDRDRSKLRTQKQKESKKDNKPMLIGKSKKFNVDRYFAILDFFINITASDSAESQMLGHSLDLLATVNSLAEEGLLKKSIMKRQDSTLDDLTTVSFKCNFDQNFITEVADKI